MTLNFLLQVLKWLSRQVPVYTSAWTETVIKEELAQNTGCPVQVLAPSFRGSSAVPVVQYLSLLCFDNFWFCNCFAVAVFPKGRDVQVPSKKDDCFNFSGPACELLKQKKFWGKSLHHLHLFFNAVTISVNTRGESISWRGSRLGSYKRMSFPQHPCFSE